MTPADRSHAVSRADLGEVFATTLHPPIEIGTVHPSTDLDASLFVDELLRRSAEAGVLPKRSTAPSSAAAASPKKAVLCVWWGELC